LEKKCKEIKAAETRTQSLARTKGVMVIPAELLSFPWNN
jgi:hypothetical protein